MIKEANELEYNVSVNTLIYGTPGIGKTTFALSASKPVLIDCDSGLVRVNPIDLKKHISVESWQDILSILDENLKEYDTIIIDTVGKALDYLADYLIKADMKNGKTDGALSLKGYGALKTSFSSFVKRVRLLNKHLILVAHDKEDKKGDELIVRPDIVGGSLNIVTREMDMIGYLEIVGNKRTINFNGTDRYYGKNSCDLPANIEISDYRKDARAFKMTDVISAYELKIETSKRLAEQYNEILSDAGVLIDSIESPTNADEVLKSIKKLPVIWDSLIKCKTALLTRTKDLGFTFNTKSDKFEASKAKAKDTATDEILKAAEETKNESK